MTRPASGLLASLRALRRRSDRSLAILGLVLAQVQFAWVTGLHPHDLTRGFTLPTASIQEDVAGRPDMALQTPCLACQVVRQAVARPAASFLMPRPVTENRRCLETDLSSVPAPTSTILPARAPPLS